MGSVIGKEVYGGLIVGDMFALVIKRSDDLKLRLYGIICSNWLHIQMRLGNISGFIKRKTYFSRSPINNLNE